MANTDTIRLLKECDSGTKMAVTSIDEILEQVQNQEMKHLLQESKKHHELLGNEIHSMLIDANSEEKDPAPLAKGMSWMKTNIKLTMNNSDSTIADLITDGCDMGTKSLHRYMNQYPTADKKARNICTKIIDIEEQLCRDLRKYL